MKCKNCGGDYRTRELICPYCGTENLVGRLWMAQRTEAEQEYEAYRREAGRRVSPYVINRVFGRIAVLMAGLCILTLVGSVIVLLTAQLMHQYAVNRVDMEKKQQTMDTLYQENRLPELYAYMSAYDLIGEDQYVYTQAVLLNFDYENYRSHLLEFLELTEEEKQQDDYYLAYSIRWGNDVYQCRLGSYYALADENQTLYDSYCDDIRDSFVYAMGMTPEEADQILTSDTADYRTYNELAETLIERGAYLHEAGEK